MNINAVVTTVMAAILSGAVSGAAAKGDFGDPWRFRAV